jgi:VanZ family protein
MTKNKLKNLIRFLPVVVWMIVIFCFSSRRMVSVSENYLLSFLFFKSIHFVEYGILFLLWKLALYKTRNGTKLALFFSILFAASDEFHQTLVPTREGKIRDVFIDTLGITFFWYFLSEKFEKYVLENKIFKKIISV